MSSLGPSLFSKLPFFADLRIYRLCCTPSSHLHLGGVSTRNKISSLLYSLLPPTRRWRLHPEQNIVFVVLYSPLPPTHRWRLHPEQNIVFAVLPPPTYTLVVSPPGTKYRLCCTPASYLHVGGVSTRNKISSLLYSFLPLTHRWRLHPEQYIVFAVLPPPTYT